jgi:hypothetical protein
MIGILAMAVGTAQQKPRPKSTAKPGIVSGRVFAVTKSGDLKPARMAPVYLLYEERIYRDRKEADAASKAEQDTAALAWMDNLNKAMEKHLQAMEEHGKTWEELDKERDNLIAMENAPGVTFEQTGKLIEANRAIAAKQREANVGWSDSSICHKELLVYQSSLVEALKWVSDKHKEWQVIRADTDEDGVFKIVVDRPGKYILLAHGQAGFNDAFWVSDDFAVKSESEISLKVSNPKEACLVSE